jgi:hypothetical protein
MAKNRIKPVSVAGKGVISAPNNTISVSTNKESPVFCFQYVMKGFHIRDCDSESSCHFINTLFDLSQMTWDDIYKLHRHKKGCQLPAHKWAGLKEPHVDQPKR